MIITDITQIDRLAREVLTGSSPYITVDMADYNRVKKNSASLKAIKLEVAELNAEAASTLSRELAEAGDEHISNILFYIDGEEGKASIDNFSYERLIMLLDTFKNHSETANILWGLGCDQEDHGWTLFAVIGYSR